MLFVLHALKLICCDRKPERTCGFQEFENKTFQVACGDATLFVFILISLCGAAELFTVYHEIYQGRCIITL